MLPAGRSRLLLVLVSRFDFDEQLVPLRCGGEFCDDGFQVLLTGCAEQIDAAFLDVIHVEDAAGAMRQDVA